MMVCPVCEGKKRIYVTEVGVDEPYQGYDPCWECGMTGEVDEGYFLQKKLLGMGNRPKYTTKFDELVSQNWVCDILMDDDDRPF